MSQIDIYLTSKNIVKIKVVEEFLAKLSSLDEINNGRNILKFRLFRNDLDITNEVNNQGYCYPITFPFSDTKSNYIYMKLNNYENIRN